VRYFLTEMRNTTTLQGDTKLYRLHRQQRLAAPTAPPEAVESLPVTTNPEIATDANGVMLRPNELASKLPKLGIRACSRRRCPTPRAATSS
jgi:hypothetical protein